MKIYIITEQWCNGASTGTEQVKAFFTLKAAQEWLKRHLRNVIANRLSTDADEYGYLGPEYAVHTDFEEADIQSVSRFSLWLARDDDEHTDDADFSEYRRAFDIEAVEADETGGGVELEDGRILTVLTAKQQSTVCKLICREIDEADEIIRNQDGANGEGDVRVAEAWKSNLKAILTVL